MWTGLKDYSYYLWLREEFIICKNCDSTLRWWISEKRFILIEWLPLADTSLKCAFKTQVRTMQSVLKLHGLRIKLRLSSCPMLRSPWSQASWLLLILFGTATPSIVFLEEILRGWPTNAAHNVYKGTINNSVRVSKIWLYVFQTARKSSWYNYCRRIYAAIRGTLKIHLEIKEFASSPTSDSGYFWNTY